MHHPIFMYPYQFTKPDVKVFCGSLYLTFDKEEDVVKKSSLATGVYCELCDIPLEFDKKKNPHMVVNHVCRVHPKRMAHLHQEQAKKEANDARQQQNLVCNAPVY
jgi:hypothetical protein